MEPQKFFSPEKREASVALESETELTMEVESVNHRGLLGNDCSSPKWKDIWRKVEVSEWGK